MRRNLSLRVKMKQPPISFPLFVVLCFSAGQFTSGYPQPLASYLAESDIPKSEMSRSILDICNSMFNSWKIDEDNQEIYKRFLFHYSRGQEPTYPHKYGKSQIAAAEFTTKEGLDALGRPFFLFRISTEDKLYGWLTISPLNIVKIDVGR